LVLEGVVVVVVAVFVVVIVGEAVDSEEALDSMDQEGESPPGCSCCSGSPPLQGVLLSRGNQEEDDSDVDEANLGVPSLGPTNTTEEA
jgi:hypothetical protein